MIAVDKKYIGVPYEKLTCWPFICWYYLNELGIDLPSYDDEYKDETDIRSIKKLYDREMANKTWPEVMEPEYPDIAVFLIGVKMGKIYHSGIVLGDNRMLHIQRGCESVIEKYTSMRWKNRLYGFYRYAG